MDMMLYPAMNKLTSVVPNRYMLVNVVARRARQIADEAEESGERLSEKPVTIAINEVAGGAIRLCLYRRRRRITQGEGEAWRPQ